MTRILLRRRDRSVYHRNSIISTLRCNAFCAVIHAKARQKFVEVRLLFVYFRLFMTLVHISISPFFASLSGKAAMD